MASDLRTFEVTRSRGNPDTYELEATLPAVATPHRFGSSSMPPLAPLSAATTEPQPHRSNYLEIDGPKPPRLAELPESHRRIFIASPDEKKSATTAAREILARLRGASVPSPRHRRRAPPPYVSLFKPRLPTGRVVRDGVEGSPWSRCWSRQRFLFRIENDGPAARSGGVAPGRRLRARQPSLVFPLEQHARRRALRGREPRSRVPCKGSSKRSNAMLARRQSERPRPELRAASGCKHGASRTAIPDAKLFPQFDDCLRDAMAQEPILLFDALLRENRSITSLPRRRLHLFERATGPALRRLGGRPGPRCRRVAVTDVHRGGILTHGQCAHRDLDPCPHRAR